MEWKVGPYEPKRHRIDDFEIWRWRRMLRISWTAKRTNVSILSSLRVKYRPYTICHRRILSYFGHIMRCGDNSLDNLVVVRNVRGQKIARPVSNQMDIPTKRDCHLKFHNTVKMAIDRSWRRQFAGFRVVITIFRYEERLRESSQKYSNRSLQSYFN